jgi:hypothetical protein
MTYKRAVYVLSAVLLIGLLLTMVACDPPNHPTYGSDNPDPNPPGRPAAVITEIDPPAGFRFQEVTIRGSGFDTDPKKTQVAVGSYYVEKMSLTENEIVVMTPDIVDDTVMVRVAVWGSENFSNHAPFIFYDVVSVIDDEIVDPTGVAVDDALNTYISSSAANAIYKINFDGEKTVHANLPITGTLRIGAQDYLYAATTSGVSRVSTSSSVVESYVTGVSNAFDFDWDANGDMYVINANGLYKRTAAGTATLLVQNPRFTAVRVFDGAVYVTEGSRRRVWRHEITGTGVGAAESRFLYTTILHGLDFDENGHIYVTMPQRDHILEVDHSDQVTEWYPARLPTGMRAINYIDRSIYVVNPAATPGNPGIVWRAYISVKQAPNYGTP